MSLLKHPSAAMEKLLHTVDRKCPDEDERALQRPVMSFIIQRHDLEGLQLAMKQALRKAACRVFAMQVSANLHVHFLKYHVNVVILGSGSEGSNFNKLG